MKNTFLLLFAVTALLACNSKENKTVDPATIAKGPTVNDSISAEQMQKIKRIHETFKEVYPISLKETTDNFKRDLDVNNEITIWMNMADAYEKYLSSKTPAPDLKTKKEIFTLLLSRSMMPDKEAITNSKLQILTEQEAMEVMSNYNAAPDPIDAIKK